MRQKLSIVFLALMATSKSATAEDAAPANKVLQGTWTCTSAVIDGRPLGEETVKALKLTLTADRYKTERGDQILFDSTYTTDAAKDPRQIDMIGTEGDLKGKPALGIYKLEGDTLTMCYVMPGQPRPTKFESTPQSGIFLIVWKRQ